MKQGAAKGVVYTLRIKKMYFDKILTGEKRKEYRAVKPFYKFLEDPELSEIVFHYQQPRRLRCKVLKVRKIKTPARLKDSPIGFGSRVYEITLGKVKEFTCQDFTAQ